MLHCCYYVIHCCCTPHSPVFFYNVFCSTPEMTSIIIIIKPVSLVSFLGNFLNNRSHIPNVFCVCECTYAAQVMRLLGNTPLSTTTDYCCCVCARVPVPLSVMLVRYAVSFHY